MIEKYLLAFFRNRFLNLKSDIGIWFKELADRAKDESRIVLVSSVNVVSRKADSILYPFWILFHQVVIPMMLNYLKRKDYTIVVVDIHDNWGISKFDCKLLKVCDLYFKRELPINPWQALVVATGGTRHPGYLRKNISNHKLIEKFRPVSLGVRDGDVLNELDLSKKNCDIFYVGESRDVPSRNNMRNLCAQLSKRGWRVNYQTERMTKEAYMKAMERSWICLSPCGNGWDCFRHYEAGGHGALPVMDFSSNRLYAGFNPMSQGVYCDLATKDAVDIIEKLLANRDELLNRLNATHQQVLKYHCNSQIVKYILAEIEAIKVD
jgi:hypothetical protein